MIRAKMDDPGKRKGPHCNADLEEENIDYQFYFTPGYQIYQLGQWLALEIAQRNYKAANRISEIAMRMMDRMEAAR